MNKLWSVIRNVWNVVKSHVWFDFTPFLRRAAGSLEIAFLVINITNTDAFFGISIFLLNTKMTIAIKKHVHGQ